MISPGSGQVNLKKKLQEITFLNDSYTKWKWRERKVSYGNENPEETFFVIRRATCKAGLFSLVMTNMGLVKYALEQGYIPVIDMQFNLNTYLEESQIGSKNAWEFYFEQPCGFTLQDIAHSKNVILSNGLVTGEYDFPTDEIIRNDEEYMRWRNFFQEHLQVKADILGEADSLRKRMFCGKRVLGVLCRGTDYVDQHPKNHPVQPEIEELIRKAMEVMRTRKCEWIYLATEDEKAYREFHAAFGERLRMTDAKRCENIGNRNINDISYGRKNDRYLKGREYLLNILLLSECDCLVAGSAGGTYAALLMGGEYEYRFVYDIGTY